MTDKKTPPKKLSKKDQVKELEKSSKAANDAAEKETKLPGSFMVRNKAGKKFKVSREYFLKYEGDLERVD